MARAENPVVEAADRLLKSFKSPATLLIAVSGGSDSTGLLVALATLSATGRYPHIALSACTVDHGLRAGSAEEASLVAALCARHGIAHTTRRWAGPKPEAGLQAAARAKRYELLVEAAGAAGADAVLSAHTRDDQDETVAMRAVRSRDGIGLSGMADAVLLDGAVWLLRPFLGVGRAAIRSFLVAQGESWIDDPSNSNPRFERARVRARDGVPAPEPAPGGRLSLAQRAAGYLAGSVQADGSLFLMAPPAVEAALSDPAAWRGLLLLAATAGGRTHTLEARSADRLRAFLSSGTLSRLTAGRVVFDRRRDGLYLYRECRGIAGMTLPPEGKGAWDGRYRVHNRTSRAIVVSACGEEAGRQSGGLRGPALRAHRAAPCLKFEDGGKVAEGGAGVEPLIAPYARFLPRFDLPIAQALADIVGCGRFVHPPNE
ncbi:tRNA lysidine(34) synthetase TilS [Shinella sp. BYT-45]|uniref:tRNA lysidine(34) synthetase TilS n=1 Tax=Shinella sp. BYT-45 TaxID=3377377 RepID=UPI00398109B4